MKYMGSKAKIAKDILPFIQNEIFINKITTYIEPFVGGANMIENVTCNKKIGSDINKELIALLKHVQERTDDLPEEVTRETYSEIRAATDRSMWEDWYVGAVEFLAGFNGRGFKGGYAPTGYETKADGTKVLRNYYREAKANLVEQSARIKDVEFRNCDYRAYSDVKGAFIYCDPPYQSTKGYNDCDFNNEEFWQWVRDMSTDNIVMVSEESAPEDFSIIWEKQISRTIKAQDKSKATEKLFMYSKCRDKDEEVDF